jgi:uncharacterized membrane protein YesL
VVRLFWYSGFVDKGIVANLKSLSENDPPSLRLGRTLRFGLLAAWDSLGLVCGISLTLFVALTIPVYAAYMVRGALWNSQVLLICLALVCWLLTIVPIYGGCFCVAASALNHDNPGYGDLWTGFVRLYYKFVLAGLVQMFVAATLAVNVLFYARLPGIIWMALAMVFVYLLVFWFMNCIYHFPLIVAADGGQPRLFAAFRNSFLIVLASPLYSFIMMFLLISLGLTLAISGVGMAMLGSGIIAFLSTQATRDHLVRFGLLAAPPDPDQAATGDMWRFRDV